MNLKERDIVLNRENEGCKEERKKRDIDKGRGKRGVTKRKKNKTLRKRVNEREGH